MEKAAIYTSASVDVNTSSIPIKNGEMYHWSVGQRSILNSESYKGIREVSTDNKQCEIKREGLLRYMLKLEAPYKKDLDEGNIKITKLKNEIHETKLKLNILLENIKDEMHRLVSRGYEIPNEITEPPKSNTDDSVPVKKQSINIRYSVEKAKKWIVVLVFIIILESFFGLAQFEFLSTYKNDTAILLRIAASAILIITLHIAEYQYKKFNKKLFKYYIIFGVVMLFCMLFGSLILNYFFQNSISVSEVDMNWNLNEQGVSQNSISEPKPTWIGFINQFDFIPAIFSVLIFLPMYLLSKENHTTKEEINSNKINHVRPEQNDENIVFNHLKYLQAENSNKETQLASLKAQYYHSKHYISSILLGVKQSLEDSKSEIEKYDKLIADNNNIIHDFLRKIEEHLKIYEVDFMDIYRGSINASVIIPEWPTQNDIKQYFTLKS